MSQLLEPSDQLAVVAEFILETPTARPSPRNAHRRHVRQSEDDGSGTPWHMMTRPLKVNPPAIAAAPVPSRRAQPPPSPRSSLGPRSSAAPAPDAGRRPRCCMNGDFDVGLSAFCRALGRSAKHHQRSARPRAAARGQLLRESVLGLMDLKQTAMSSATGFAYQLRNKTTRRSLPESDGGVDETLVRC